MLMICANTKDEVKEEILKYLQWWEDTHRENVKQKMVSGKHAIERETAIANNFQRVISDIKSAQIIDRS